MQNLRPSRSTLLFILPTLALPLGMLVTSILAKTAPAPVAAVPEAAETPAEATPPARMYVKLINPITVSLPEGDGTLSVEIGVALPETTGHALEKILMDNPGPILGNLASAVLDAAADDRASLDVTTLPGTLPRVLQEAMNANLSAIGEPPDILEVLMLDWAKLP